MKQTTILELKPLYIDFQIHIYALSTFFCRLENLVASAKFQAVRTHKNTLLLAEISIRRNGTKLKLPSSSKYQKTHWVCNLLILFVVCMVLHPQNTVHAITADKMSQDDVAMFYADKVIIGISSCWFSKLSSENLFKTITARMWM